MRRAASPPLDAGDARDHRLVQRATDGDGTHCQSRGLAEPLDPQHECVAQALRRRAATVERGRHQLLDVQRVAVGACQQPIDQVRGGGLAEDVGQRLRELRAVERLELEPAAGVEPAELGQKRPHRVASVQLVAAVAEQQQDPLVDQAACEEGDERPRRAVGPVHVLEHQHQRLANAQQVQELEQALEQPHLAVGARAGGACRRCAEARQQGREVCAAGGAELVECRVAAPAPAAAARRATARREARARPAPGTGREAPAPRRRIARPRAAAASCRRPSRRRRGSGAAARQALRGTQAPARPADSADPRSGCLSTLPGTPEVSPAAARAAYGRVAAASRRSSASRAELSSYVIAGCIRRSSRRSPASVQSGSTKRRGCTSAVRSDMRLRGPYPSWNEPAGGCETTRGGRDSARRGSGRSGQSTPAGSKPTATRPEAYEAGGRVLTGATPLTVSVSVLETLPTLTGPPVISTRSCSTPIWPGV